MSLLDFEYQLSPYYHKGHKEYRAYCRKFVKENLEPYAEDWIKKGKFNIHEYSKTLAEYGGIWYFPFGHCNTKWNGYDWDPFFQIIFYQEFAKPVFLAKSHVHRICIDPIEMFGKSEVHKNALKQISTGDKLICLAISEMSGGSDVKSIKTTATLSKDGKHYIVNGNKYWITAGLRADYFVTAVRTGTVEDGRNGVSLFLIPRTKGVYTSRLSLQGLNLSDTAVVTFANVKVPKENIIGELLTAKNIICISDRIDLVISYLKNNSNIRAMDLFKACNFTLKQLNELGTNFPKLWGNEPFLSLYLSKSMPLQWSFHVCLGNINTNLLSNNLDLAKKCFEKQIRFVLDEKKCKISWYKAAILINYLQFTINNNIPYDLEVLILYLHIPKMSEYNVDISGNNK
eukprot:286478_1